MLRFGDRENRSWSTDLTDPHPETASTTSFGGCSRLFSLEIGLFSDDVVAVDTDPEQSVNVDAESSFSSPLTPSLTLTVDPPTVSYTHLTLPTILRV